MKTQQNSNGFRISLQNIELIYNQASIKGLNMREVLTYTYFFSGPTLGTLKTFAKTLKKENFVMTKRYVLHNGREFALELVRKEIHTPRTLYDLGNRLAELSSKFAVDYGGFEADVYMDRIER